MDSAEELNLGVPIFSFVSGRMVKSSGGSVMECGFVYCLESLTST